MSWHEDMEAIGVSERQIGHWIKRGFINQLRGGPGNTRILELGEERVGLAMARLVVSGFVPEHAARVARKAVGAGSPGQVVKVRLRGGVVVAVEV